MSKYRNDLPQLGDRLFLTDGGLETTLIFHEGWDLPAAEAFVLMETQAGRKALTEYFDRYIPMALTRGLGFILESPTWRANPDWGTTLGYGRGKLGDFNRASIAMMSEIGARYETKNSPMVISGCIGPRGDGYDPGKAMTVNEAEDYHSWQIEVFRNTAADLVSAITMTNMNEAMGIARAARALDMPCVISFTLETDGHLPTGESLAKAIDTIDTETNARPAYYMINCAHPTHFEHILDGSGTWSRRMRGLRANSSCLSHAELDNAPELDTGNPEELAQQYVELRARLPWINVLGGCCGTDHRHVGAICEACAA